MKILQNSVRSMTLLIAILAFAGSSFGGEIERIKRHEARFFEPGGSTNHEFTAVAKTAEFEDTRISELVTPSVFNQTNSSIILFDDGSFTVIWQDERDGIDAIYGQKYNVLGAKIGANRTLVLLNSNSDALEPKAVSNGANGFYLTYRDINSGLIAGKIFNSDLNSITDFEINNLPYDNFAGPYDIASYENKRFAVVWEEYSLSNNIVLRLFDSVGTALTDPILINDDGLDVSHWVPSVAFDHLGNLGVAWEDYRNGNPDIFIQLVNSDGSMNGGNLSIVAGQFVDSTQYLPEIEYSERDGYAIAWLDNRDAVQKVYLQRLIPASGLDGANRQISEGASDDWDISMAVNSGHNLAICWSEDAVDDNIKLQRFSADFTLNDTVVTVNSAQSEGRWKPSVSFGQADNFLFSWSDQRSGNSDIYLHYLDINLSPIFIDEEIVNDDQNGSFAIDPQIALIDENNGVISFTNNGNDDGDIYCQLIDSDGNLSGSNIKINADAAGSFQAESAISANDSTILVVWNDGRPITGVSGQRIYARYLSHDGLVKSDEFVLSDSASLLMKAMPSVALSSDLSAMAVWVDLRTGQPQIYGQVIDISGIPTGSAYMISNDGTDFNNSVPHVKNSQDGFIIGWLAEDNLGERQIVFKSYDTDGIFLDRFIFANNIDTDEISDFDFDPGPTGEITIVWEKFDINYDLFVSRLSSSGTTLISYRDIYTSGRSPFKFHPDIAVDSDNSATVISIHDTKLSHYQILNNTLNMQLEDFGGLALDNKPAVAIGNHNSWMAWPDNRNGGTSIYAKSINFVPVDVTDNNDSDILPNQFKLSQNYPNPFNPATEIGFALPEKAHVNIIIYNILGEKIEELVDENYEAGYHTVNWMATDMSGQALPTGIYLYKMTAGEFKAVNKMLLMK